VDDQAGRLHVDDVIYKPILHKINPGNEWILASLWPRGRRMTSGMENDGVQKVWTMDNK